MMNELCIALWKMLFRKPIRGKLFLLVIGLTATIFLNNYNYFKEYKKIETAKKELLRNNTFKVFFLRSTTEHELKALLKSDSEINYLLIEDAFVFQENLFINIEATEQSRGNPLQVIYDIFEMNALTDTFFCEKKQTDFITIYNNGIDYNGYSLSEDKRRQRLKRVTKAIQDNLIRYLLENKIPNRTVEREFTNMADSILNGFEKASLKSVIFNEKNEKQINPYLNRVKIIIPRNILDILIYIGNRRMKGGDINKIVQYDSSDSIIRVRKFIIEQDHYRNTKRDIFHNNIENYWFPRFCPVYKQDFIKKGIYKKDFKENIYSLSDILFEWLEVEIVETDPLMKKLHDLHSGGYYLMSYEKLDIIKTKVDMINNNIKSTLNNFFRMDLLIGIIFPFIISFFGFIYLKKDIAFLLFHKNRIKQIIWIFYSAPLIAMLMLKTACYWYVFGWNNYMCLIKLMLLSFIIISTGYYWLNRFCFREFLDNKKLHLAELFKGR